MTLSDPRRGVLTLIDPRGLPPRGTFSRGNLQAGGGECLIISGYHTTFLPVATIIITETDENSWLLLCYSTGDIMRQKSELFSQLLGENATDKHLRKHQKSQKCKSAKHWDFISRVPLLQIPLQLSNREPNEAAVDHHQPDLWLYNWTTVGGIVCARNESYTASRCLTAVHWT